MNAYDCLGHKMNIGDAVGFSSADKYLYGTIVEIIFKTDKDYKFVVIPNFTKPDAYGGNYKSKYRISPNKLFLLNVTEEQKQKALEKRTNQLSLF